MLFTVGPAWDRRNGAHRGVGPLLSGRAAAAAIEPSAARRQNTANFGDDLFGLFRRAEHRRAEHEVYGRRREMEALAGKSAQIPVDPQLPRASLKHRMHMQIRLDSDELGATRHVAKVGARAWGRARRPQQAPVRASAT